MKPIVDGLESQYGDQVVFRRINANEGDGPAVMDAYLEGTFERAVRPGPAGKRHRGLSSDEAAVLALLERQAKAS